MPSEIGVVKSDAEIAPVNDTAEISRRPKSSSGANGIGQSKSKGKPAHKVDNSGEFAFGGTLGTTAMMLLFPVLMYYLWICATFYGGSLLVKKGSETWFTCLDRMIALTTKVTFFLKLLKFRGLGQLSTPGSFIGLLLL
jgi:hypothetical protein